ncbi:hypothetical protein GOODEAATRI_012790 [Goodea atripinnis]|uniref:Uncharacterized protein n=1 Tax=Goodea atripinnis TaxID=208336 RepID=A0ABV0PDK2_9TELE
MILSLFSYMPSIPSPLCSTQSREKSGNQGKRHSSFSHSALDQAESLVSLKRTGSNTNPYGRYGKTRAEEDARRYLREKEELETERDGIRNALVTLRQQKRELKEELKVASGDRRKSFLKKHVSQLDEACRGKEAERVDLELRLTQVKENLKKSLAGGALGAPVEAKVPVKVYLLFCVESWSTFNLHSFYLLLNFLQESGKKIQNAYSDSIPVNCAAEMRKRPPSICASSAGVVMQKAKVMMLIKFVAPCYAYILFSVIRNFYESHQHVLLCK